jgi:hypothetical protein
MPKQLRHRHQFQIPLPKSLVVFALFMLLGSSNILFAQNWDQVVKSVASDRAAYDRFGYSVSISGDYAIVGAYQEDHNLNGGQFLEDAGAAYILKNNAGTWTVVQKIVASDRAADDEFGASVAISGDYAIVGAPRKSALVGFELNTLAGAAYIFQNKSGTWSQVNKLLASDREGSDKFGSSVAISGDYAIVGAPFESHSALGYQNNKGSAYIFKKGPSVWSEEQKIVSSSSGTNYVFGWSVGISGDYAIIGSPKASVTISGGTILTEAGNAIIFGKSITGKWLQTQTLTASDKAEGDEFGHSVAISGDNAIVGAMLEEHNASGGAKLILAGSAYIFERNGTSWKQAKKLVASDRAANDMFGASVSISGDHAIVGAFNEDEDETGGNTLSNAGSAYIFKKSLGNWAQADKIVATDRGSGNLLGNSVAISEDYVILGAHMESENAIGGNTLFSAGASYIFKNCISRSTDLQSSCGPFTWIDGNTYTENNNTAVYNIVGGAASGCDSLVTLNLTINRVSDLSTTLSGETITANNTAATYQWLDCDNNYAEITGEIGATFTPAVNGNYAVELTQNGCVDTSSCVTITNLGILENSFGNTMMVYPNPTNGHFSIDLGNTFIKAEIQITDVLGKIIISEKVVSSQTLDLFIQDPVGVYFVTVKADGKKAVIRVVKNQ